MRKSIKKTLCVLSATICVLGSAVTASADTVSFNVTIPGDQYSYTVKKADSEQKFYVTGTSFNKSGTLRCRSSKVGTGIISNSAYISSNNRASSASYKTYAAPDCTYEMYATSSTSGLNVTGRFTP